MGKDNQIRKSLRNCLEEWKKSDTKIGKREYYVEVSPIADHEFVIILKISLNLTAKNKLIKTISIAQRLFTFAQDKDTNYNPHGDLYRIKGVMNSLDTELMKEIYVLYED